MTTVLAPDCYICRLIAGPCKHSGKDDILIVGFVTGYAEARTRDFIDWYTPDVCPEHGRKFEKVIASVRRQLTKEEPCSSP